MARHDNFTEIIGYEGLYAINKKGEVVEFSSSVEASKHTGALRPNISKCCNGERQSSQGWSFSKKGGN